MVFQLRKMAALDFEHVPSLKGNAIRTGAIVISLSSGSCSKIPALEGKQGYLDPFAHIISYNWVNSSPCLMTTIHTFEHCSSGIPEEAFTRI